MARDEGTSHAEERPTAQGENVIYWSPAYRMPLDLFSYFREAKRCRDERRFLASIAMASTAIELIIHKDRRLKNLATLKRIYGWATLNNGNLRIAWQNALPVETLLSAGEDLDAEQPVAFVELRNKVAHGEISHLVKDLSDYDPAAASLANDQVKKMHHFIIKWFNTAPDVQEGFIRDYQWPHD